MNTTEEAQVFNPYKVDLEIFEGPLDLLLHLVRKDKIDIGNIPIAKLLEQYHQYLDFMDELNIDLSGDFILMASELTLIKSRMLLPDETGEEDEVGEDPRADLIKRLLEYQQYKEAAGILQQRPMIDKDVFIQGVESDISEFETPLEVDLPSLMTVFSQILARAPKKIAHEVMEAQMSVTERIYELIDWFQGQARQTFEFKELFDSNSTRGELIITFLALLEMCRLRLLAIHQTDIHGALFVTPELEEKEINLEKVSLQ